MEIRPRRFNHYFLILLALIGVAGCRTPDIRATQVSVLRVHLEVPLPDPTGRSQVVTVGRRTPMVLNVDKEFILSEAFVEEARTLETFGVPELQLQLDHRGTYLLEQFSASYPGRRMVIYSQFGPNLEHTRWLAALRVPARNTTGVLTFTPDATREEMEEIALGLNNHHRKITTFR